MKHRNATIIVLLAVTAVSTLLVMSAKATGIAKDPCCFANPRYTGVCEVTPNDDESCSNILAYLNNQASVGKSYCGNTAIRGGWQSVSCESNS